ncbi:hypothetical protein, partial [Sansalvadorimonas verongulae]|uniref:hypothetical protein n=1 Tax=Sansalvadorimonas verongulae TaxID=2172824 RepID=UPI001E5F96AA
MEAAASEDSDISDTIMSCTWDSIVSQPSSEDASKAEVSRDENPSGYSDVLPLSASLGSPVSTDSQLSQDSPLSRPELFYTSTGPWRINYSDYAVGLSTARSRIDLEL